MLRRVALTIAGLIIIAGTAADAAPRRPPRPGAARTMRVKATAYCDAGKTQSGVHTRTGIVAADPRVLPVGSVVRIVDGAATGIYTVMDTGAAVKGSKIDIFIPNCARAKAFGEQTVRVHVLRHGWDPKASETER